MSRSTEYEKEFEREYEKLNSAQKEAVDATEGPVVVVAGPGTGKTQILALRIANILSKTDAGAESILCLTFTNSGVISMRERLLSVIGDTAYRVNIFTFHSFCEHLIREFPFYFRELEGARVIGDLERVQIIESIIKANKFKELVTFHDEFSFLKKIVGGILAIKDEGLSPEDFSAKLPLWRDKMLADESVYYKKATGNSKKGDIKPAEAEKIEKKIAKAEELGKIFELYQEELQKQGLYDFSDMILSVLDELKTNPNFKADVSEKYQYILIDEHQDTNEGQNEIVELMTDAPHLSGKPNLFTVGDEKQSIYRFQGASAETFSRFRSLYEGISSVSLSENYRSGQHILDGAHSLIVKSPEYAHHVRLRSNAKENEKIKIRGFSNYKFELLFLAEEIRQKIKDGVPPREIAVLYRANKNVSDIKSIFDHARIPYTVFSQDKILEDGDIKNLISILKVVFNPNDDASLGKALFSRFLGMDAYDIVKILERHRTLRKAEKKHVFEILGDKKFSKEAGLEGSETAANFVKTIKELKVDSENMGFPDFFKIFLQKTGYLGYMLESADSRLKFAKLDKLFDEVKRQHGSRKNYSLRDFLYFTDSFTKYDLDIKSTDPEIIEGVSLATAHGSKGKEFEYVYIVNATRKSWEARRAGSQSITLPIYQYDGDMEDERRLFYVAMTRAKKGLAISFSRTDDDGREHEESEFVREIGDEFKVEEDMGDFEKKNMESLHAFLEVSGSHASLLEPEFLRQLFFKRGLNVSALNNFLACPIRYLYRNLIQLPDITSPSQLYGNIVDTALNAFFRRSKEKEEILPRKALLEEFEKSLASYALSEKDEQKFRERGQEALGGYYDEYAGSWTIHTDVQKYVERDFELDNRDTLRLSGTIDKIEYLDDLFTSVRVVDHKTGRTFSEKPKEERENYERQLVFYKLLLENSPREEIIVRESVLDFVEKNKKGRFERYALDVTKEQTEKLREEINSCADAVLSMKFIDMGCKKKECEWCQMPSGKA